MRHIFKELKRFDKKVKSQIELIIDKPSTRPNFTELSIIEYLFKNQEKTIYQKDLADVLNLKKSSVTERLDIMENKGMIERISDEKDNRKKEIRLSKKAIEKKSEFIGVLESIENEALKDIPEDKINIFFEVLDKMSENLERGQNEINS